MKELLILSGKGGTGKTTIASAFIRLAEARAYADCDVDAPNLHLVADWETEPERRDYFGLPKARIDRDLCIQCDRCYQHCRFHAIRKDDGYQVDPYACEGCAVCSYVCPAGAVTMEPSHDGELRLYEERDLVFSTAELKMGSGTSGLLVTEVKKDLRRKAVADFAIIDGSPGIGCPVIASLSGVDMVLIVAEPSVSGFSDMERIIQTAARFGTKMAVCVNKSDTNPELSAEIEDYCRDRGLLFVGTIPFDSEAVKAVNRRQTIVDIECSSGKAVREIYRRTMDALFEKEGA
ncbi:MAG: ATP-binding protein [Bacillota bacterium]|nr:ATP-binding protein [Bacillota bacterium]